MKASQKPQSAIAAVARRTTFDTSAGIDDVKKGAHAAEG
jgi:hypothetical protein